MKKLQGIFIGLGIMFASTTYAQVVINEIAWMGNSASANAEWIELANQSASSIDFSGWVLTAVDGSPAITLSGTIPPNGYYLLERTSDASVPTVTADSIYSGAFGNTGEHLVLKDDLGNVVDELDATAGWPGGDNTNKQTMQKLGESWITGEPTPKRPTVGSGDNENTDTTDSSEDQSDGAAENTNTSKQQPEIEQVEKVAPDPVYSAKMNVPDYAGAGIRVPIHVMVTKKIEAGKLTELSRGKFIWSMGDGKQYEFIKNTPIEHIFYYPGTYVITLKYYSSVLKPEPDSIHRKKIKIIAPDIAISGITEDGGVIIHNNTSQEVDMYQWKIKHGSQSYTFPEYTMIGPGQKLSLAPAISGIASDTIHNLILLTPEGNVSRSLKSKRSVDIHEEVLNHESGDTDAHTQKSEEKKPYIVPTQKTFTDLWNDQKTLIVLGILGVVLLLAYFAYHLYSERTHLFHDDE